MRRSFISESYSRSSVPGLSDQIWSPLYDFERIEVLSPELHFFQRPIGAPGMEPKTDADTNMCLAGHLPTGQHFIATGIRVMFVPDFEAHRGRYKQDLQDYKRVLLGGHLEFVIQNRVYSAGAPLARFPACLPLFSDIDEKTFRRYLRKRILLRAQKLNYFAIVPVYVQANQFFRVSIRYPDKQRFRLNAPGRLGVILDGHIIRPVC